MNPGLTEAEREACERCMAHAPTVLENYFWAWILGLWEAPDYLDELVITPLSGPGHVPDDFKGEM